MDKSGAMKLNYLIPKSRYHVDNACPNVPVHHLLDAIVDGCGRPWFYSHRYLGSGNYIAGFMVWNGVDFSHVMRVRGLPAGDIDAAGKEIDGEMTLSPLVTMDRIINLIPLLRDTFREKKSGFLFFVYSIKGPLDDPEIQSSYVRSVEERIVYLLRNVIKLPKALWDQLRKELQR